jgi:hypothetical protein
MIRSDIEKSKSLDTTGVNGIINLGKYTLVNIEEELIKLFDAVLRDEEKYVHGITAKAENNGYGISSTSGFIPASLPKIKLNTTI